MRRATPAIVVIALVCSVRTAFAAGLPQLDWDRPIRCMGGPAGTPVRVQCANPRTCLVAPDRTLEGAELQRTRSCDRVDGDKAYAKLERSGVRLVPALAEAPPGFARAEGGRAYQVKFDLLDRVYLGVGWMPTFQRASPGADKAPGFPFGRAAIEVGFEASVLSPRGRSRHDFKVLQGSASFTDFELHGLLFAYDYQHVHKRPAYYITTFFGAPRVHGLAHPLGFGFRILSVEDRPPGQRNALDMELGEFHLAWNPWQSTDMYSHLRVEAGADLGKNWEDRHALRESLSSGRWYGGFSGAIRSRLALGEGGLHYLFADVAYLHPTFIGGDLGGRGMSRVKASFAYEGVLIAVNDQPISLRLAATGAAREDPLTDVHTVELGMHAGLRFSLWAPPRRFEPLPAIEDP